MAHIDRHFAELDLPGAFSKSEMDSLTQKTTEDNQDVPKTKLEACILDDKSEM